MSSIGRISVIGAGSVGATFACRFFDMDNWYSILSGLSPHGKTSMLQNIEARRKTEVEPFAGKVIELGMKYGISTPVNLTIYRSIKVIE